VFAFCLDKIRERVREKKKKKKLKKQAVLFLFDGCYLARKSDSLIKSSQEKKKKLNHPPLIRYYI